MSFLKICRQVPVLVNNGEHTLHEDFHAKVTFGNLRQLHRSHNRTEESPHDIVELYRRHTPVPTKRSLTSDNSDVIGVVSEGQRSCNDDTNCLP